MPLYGLVWSVCQELVMSDVRNVQSASLHYIRKFEESIPWLLT
jgi:hypothetical protein